MSKHPTRRLDPAATRTAIMAAAETLFTERGFAGTSMRDIAIAADVGVSLIVHHFGSKEDLWDTIKQHRFANYATGQEDMLRTRAASADLLVESLRAYFRWLRDNPSFLRLMAWRDLERNVTLSEQETRLITLSRQRMREAREAGWFQADVDPDLALFAIFTMLEGWFSSAKRSYFSDLEAEDERYFDTILALLRHGLIAPKGNP
jgi:TetR/AcrR family transcriptional regulator